MKKVLVSTIAVILCVAMVLSIVACEEAKPSEALQKAYDYLKVLHQDASEVTASDYDLPGKVLGYDVDWALNVTEGNANGVVLTPGGDMINVDVDEYAAADIKYTLTATVSEGETSLTLVLNRKVPKFVVNTYEEWLAGCVANDKEASFTIMGYIIAVNAAPLSSSKGSLWIQDADGHGYYAYAPELEESVVESRESINAYFPIGTKVIVRGSVTLYNGTYEFNKGCSVEKLDATAESDGVALTYKDATADFAAASANNDEALVPYQSIRAELKGVTLGANNGKNYYFTLDSGVDFVMYMDYYAIDEATLEALKAKWEVGATANLKGFVNVYSKIYQIYPDSIDSVEIVVEDLSDAEKVARAKDILDIDTYYSDNFNLPLTGAQGTTISWALAEASDVLSIGADGAVTLNKADEDVVVTLVATIASGDATDTKSFEITIAGAVIDWKDAAWAIAEAKKLDGDNKEISEGWYYIYGTIIDDPTADYCNFTLTDGTDKLIVYGLATADGSQRYGSKRDIAELPVKKGDVVYLYAQLQNYGGKLELVGTARLQPAPAAGSTIAAPMTPAQAIAETKKLDGDSKEISQAWYYVKGQIIDDPTADYCNFNLTDGTDNLIVYGLATADGSQRYGSKRDIAELPVKKGQIVTLYAQLQNYNGKLELVGTARLIAVEEAPAPECTAHVDENNDYRCDNCDVFVEKACTTDAEIFAMAAALKAGESFTAAYTLEGVVKSIDIAYSADYKNVTITLTVGENEIQCFRLKGDGADTLAVGDSVKVKGIITNYNGKVQFNAGCEIVVEGETPDPDPNPNPDPTPSETVAKTVAEFLALEDSTSVCYYVEGVVTKIANTTYGNVYIADDSGILYVYGLCAEKMTLSSEGKWVNAQDFATLGLAVGDHIKIVAYKGSYNGAGQAVGSGLVEKTAATDNDKALLVVHTLSVPDRVEADFSLPTSDIATVAWAVVEGDAISLDGVAATVVRGAADASVTVKATITVGSIVKEAEFDIIVAAEVGEGGPAVTFTFGANGEAAHVDGNDIGTGKTYESGNYSLVLTDASKVYDGATDLTGVSCLKLGTSSVVGTVTFAVPDDVTSVVIYVAMYKAKATVVDINGTTYTIETSSNDGAYTALTIDTSSVKTIVFSTTSGKTRCMIDRIEFYN